MIIQEISLSLIDMNPHAIREIDPETLNDLTESIKQYGVLQPILVNPIEEHFEVIFGNHRLLAAKRAGLKTIPTLIREVKYIENLLLQLTENIHRADVNPFVEGKIFSEILKKPDHKLSWLSQKIGKSSVYIKKRLKLYEGLDPELASWVGDRLTLSNAFALIKYDKIIQKGIAKQIIHAREKVVGMGFGSLGLSEKDFCTCPLCGRVHKKEIKNERARETLV